MDGCVWHVGTPGGPTQTLAAWVMPKRVWQVGAEITMGSAPPWPCLPLFILAHFGNISTLTHTHTLVRAHTHTCTLVYAFAHRHSAGLSPDLLNLASDSGTCYWKSWSEFYAFDLVGEKYCKGYQHGRGRPAPIVSSVCYYTNTLKQTLVLTSN